jgi:hypothetical protein
MIARFRVRLRSGLLVPTSVGGLEPQTREMAGLMVRIFPPYKSQLTDADLGLESNLPLTEYVARLVPMDPPVPVPDATVGGESVVRADALPIDMWRELDFNRVSGTDDPPTELFFNIANDWLMRFRVLAQVPSVRPVQSAESVWSIRYLNDDETELVEDPTLAIYRQRAGSHFQATVSTLDQQAWAALAALTPGYVPASSEHLALDAVVAFHEGGPAVVLAHTALETRIAEALELLAPMYGVRPTIWSWIGARGNYLKEPSTGEQFDSLLKAITGRSLKDEPALWEAYRNLAAARNSFVHHGQAMIGNQPVDGPTAARLLDRTRDILDWIDGLLPEANRRIRLIERSPVVVTRNFNPKDESAEDEAPSA